MYINEIEKGQDITLSVKIGTETVEFKTIAQDPIPKKRAILADTVTENGKVVSFNSSSISIDLFIYPPDSAPILFRKVQVILYKDKSGTIYYAIVCNSPSVTFNRREAFRIFIGEKVVIQKGSNRSADDVILKDLCSQGFSVTVDKSDMELEINQTIHTVFSDRIEETFQNFSFHLYGIIIRKDELENGKVVYGCKLNAKVPGLENYIMLKERLRIKNKNGN